VRRADRGGASGGLDVTGFLLVVALLCQERPRLPADRDTNDWVSYNEQGLREIDRHPDRALRYFEYAARLDPSVAEPLLGRYAAWWRSHGRLKNRMWSDKPSDTDSAVATEQWLDEADLRNPFVRQTVLTWTAPRRVAVNPFHSFTRGLAAFFGGEWSWSVQEFTASIERKPENLPEVLAAYRYRALALAQLGRWSEAADDLDRLLKRIGDIEQTETIRWDMGKARLYYTVALMRQFAGQSNWARLAFERAFEIDLGFPIAHVYYGNLLLSEGDTAGGLREYAMAAELRPSDPFIRQNYGAILFNLGRLDSALTHLTEAVRLAPDYAILYFNRALCLEQLGRSEEARAMHQEFVARAPRRLKPLIQQSERFLSRQP
jgi:tetratricopeptide (TPR) repeat protein